MCMHLISLYSYVQILFCFTRHGAETDLGSIVSAYYCCPVYWNTLISQIRPHHLCI
jgi:hypothetical protein